MAQAITTRKNCVFMKDFCFGKWYAQILHITLPTCNTVHNLHVNWLSMYARFAQVSISLNSPFYKHCEYDTR